MNTAETRAAEAWADFESYQAQEKAKQLRPFTVRIGKRGSPEARACSTYERSHSAAPPIAPTDAACAR